MRRFAGVVVFVVGCAGSPEDTTPAAACEGDFDVFEPGMEVRTTQGNFYVELTEATPDPPDEGLNDWVVTVTSQTGSPVNGGSLTLTPWMPEHDHGLNPPNYRGAPSSGPGVYDVDPFDLIMPGIWEFRFLVTESMMNDTVSVSFCIEG